MTANHPDLESTIAGTSAELREAMESYLEELERGACPEPERFIKRYPAIADELPPSPERLGFHSSGESSAC